MFDPPYALWTIWKQLSSLQCMFVLVIIAVSLYTFVSGIKVLFRLRQLRKSVNNPSALQVSLPPLYLISTNVRQVITAAFYLFGVVLFLSLEGVVVTLGDGKTPVGFQVLGKFVLDCAFAANVFFVFLILHFFQWFVCRRAESYPQYASNVQA